MSEVKDMLLEIRERVIRIETKFESHLESMPELKAQVAKHDREILKAKTSVNVMRWFAGIVFITIPATVYAVFRVVKGGI